MYVILIHYTKPLEEVQKHSTAHREYLSKFYQQGSMIASGRRTDLKGGVLLANVASQAEVEQMIAADPYKSAGVAEYEVIDFHPSLYAQDFGTFIRNPPPPAQTQVAPEPGASGDVVPGAR